jgi:dTDP-4-amino-4,6-dideoxygalactose transaminase
MSSSVTKSLKKFVKTSPFLAKIARQQMQRVARVTNPWSLFPRDLPPTSLDYLREVVASGFTADVVPQFETQFAKMIGTRHAFAVSNCTAAVHTVLACSGLEPGDEVIVSPIADYGDIQGLLTECLVPVFPDVDVVTGNVTAEHIERVLTPRSRAVLLVHFYGLVADIRPIVALCERHGLLLIEDCCQSILAADGEAKTGTFGAAGCFSLDREKHFSTDGGGVIVTDDDALAEKYRRFAYHRGCEYKEGYGRVHSALGYNYRYNMLQAAVGLAHLETFEARMARRMMLAQRLAQQLADVEGIILPPVKQANGHAYWLFHFLVDPDRFSVSIEALREALVAKRIPCSTAPYYLVPESHTLLHRPCTPTSKEIIRGWELAASRYDYTGEMCPNAKTHLARTLRWLWSEHLNEVDVDKMAQIIKETLVKYRR